MQRSISVIVGAVLGVVASAVVVAPAAFAAAVPVTDMDELFAAVNGCADGTVVQIDADIDGNGSSSVAVSCDLVLDLHGHLLQTAWLVGGASTLTIDDSAGGGELRAESSSVYEPGIYVDPTAGLVIDGGTVAANGDAAGIGAGSVGPGSPGAAHGAVTINGGDVTAEGGGLCAGIGACDVNSVSGPIMITGGTVTAIGGSGAAAIGGGQTPSVTITGGEVDATAAVGAASPEVGIGGGHFGDGGAVVITGGVVTAAGQFTAIGGGAAGEKYGDETGTGRFGSLTIGGTATVHLPSGRLLIPDSDPSAAEVVIEDGGRLLGTEADPTAGAKIEGDVELAGVGQIDNHGVIGLAGELVLVPVADRDFDVAFDPQNGAPASSVRVFAASLAEGFRTLPTPPAGSVWNTLPDGTGDAFNADSPIEADLTVYAVDAAYRELSELLENCTDGDTVTLTADAAGAAVVIGCILTLDLAGHLFQPASVDVRAHLTIDDTVGGGRLLATLPGAFGGAGIHVPPGAALTVRAGEVTAQGDGGAAIGGGGEIGESAGAITITGGTVTATATYGGAGIGGGQGFSGGGDGGVLSIEGGTVTATSDFGGAGIGGGSAWSSGGGGVPAGDGGTTMITGGTVTATGVGAGIGGGSGSGAPGGVGGAGGATSILGGEVTAIGANSSAIGGGDAAAAFGSLTLAGTLRMPTGALIVPDSNPAGSEVVIEAGGLLAGPGGAPTQGATVTGDGQIDNHGVIALDGALVATTVTVHDHDYAVDFDGRDVAPDASVRLFAPDFASGYRTVPPLDAPDAWNTAADGSGAWFDATTPVTADTTLYAATDAVLTLVASADTVAQGGSLSFTVAGEDRHGAPVDTRAVVLTSSVTSDVVDGLTVTFPHASPHLITATLGTASATVEIEVDAAAPPKPTPSASGELSTTGAVVLAPAATALLALAAGLGLLAIARRGRRA
ncbi:hypothetical protein ACFVTX_10465 [Agromyces sp. NPDC058136]|uniref:hypothetical protein n=1 Tax=Agromyces sp. NPDC058136 TaxID=3346354 RepID=UPI0036D899A5